MSSITPNNSNDNGFGAARTTYLDQLVRFFDACYGNGIIELRVPKTAEGTRFGFYRDHAKLAEQALKLSGTAPGIYTTVNCVPESLLVRAPEITLIQQSKQGVSRDEDIERLLTLLIDGDPVRQKDTSSTDEEHREAIERIAAVRLWLKEEHGWADPVVIDSGNGGHLRYRIDLLNTEANVALLHAVLIALKSRFNDDKVKIDTTTFNPSRVAKIPFTLAAKGVASIERPHRQAVLIALPLTIETVSPEQLNAAAACGRKQEARSIQPAPRTPQNGSVQQLGILEKLLRSDAKFARLWSGDTSEYGNDESRADNALCCKLIFYFGRDAGLVDYYFRQSGLMRPKWNEPRPGGTYGSITIDAALGQQQETYDPDHKPPEPRQKQEGKPQGSGFTWRDVPCVFDLEAHVDWVVEELIPEAAVTLLTGDSGHGKTILATALAGCIVHGKDFLGYKVKRRKVLYMDRENSLGVVKQHLHDLKIERTQDLIIWGGWCKEPPDTPAAGSLIEFVRAEQPVIIWDSLIAFHTGDEQSATDTRKYLQLYRRLAEEGATVIVLHHTGKSEGAKQYRGSSDIKASVDVAWFLEKLGDPSGLLKDMRLVAFKNRMGGGRSLPLVFTNGGFESAQERPETEKERMERIVAGRPGQGARTLIELGKAVGISKQHVLDLLKDGAMTGTYELRQLGANKYGYFIKEPDLGL